MIRTTLLSRPPARRIRTFSTTMQNRRPGPPSLPRLPVPDLKLTLQRYLASLEPLMLEDDRKGKEPYSAAYARRSKMINEFETGIGRVLQERLLALDRESPNNWLDDNFWINKAYLEWRTPLLVNSNWWLAFHDDDLIPESARLGKALQTESLTGITPWQVRRAAWLVHRTLDFKHKLDSQELHPDTTRTGIWFRRSTEKMFNIARIPQPTCDTLSSPNPSSPDSQKLLLMLHNFCYAIPMYSPNTYQLLSARDIEALIFGVVKDVERRLTNGEKAFPIGALSADDRDCWAKNLKRLVSLHPQNRKNYDALLNSVMALSLEHSTHTLPKSPRSKYQPQSIAQHNLDGHLHTIRSQEHNYSNRFFDKPYTLIVDSSTQAGATGEHSPCDALVPSIVAEYAIVQGVDDVYFHAEPSLENASSTGWERLDWVVDNNLQEEHRAAHARNLQVIENSDDSVLWFEGYGSDWIRGISRLPPDAFIQMALQLAWYKTRKEFTATYETVLTRMFKHGRTETLRTLTKDSRAWVLAMSDPRSSTRERYSRLKDAIAMHSRLTKEAATGKGIDRHLLGLRLMLKPEEIQSSSLFSDKLFNRSQEWKLSTSGLSAGLLFRGTGFGSPYEDGYGINYLAAPQMIKFGIESKYSSPLTSTESFKEAIVESLYEMRVLCSDDAVLSIDVPSHL